MRAPVLALALVPELARTLQRRPSPRLDPSVSHPGRSAIPREVVRGWHL